MELLAGKASLSFVILTAGRTTYTCWSGSVACLLVAAVIVGAITFGWVYLAFFLHYIFAGSGACVLAEEIIGNW